jgi:NitT/TauT family transport system permease protein
MTTGLLRYLPLVLLALAWEASARTGLVSTLALPPLSEVVVAWIELARSGELITKVRPRSGVPGPACSSRS